MKDYISREMACDYIAEFINNPYSTQDECEMVEAMIDGMQHIPPITPQPKTGHWIPVKWHEITDEERKENDYPKDWVCYLDSKMPYDGQRILVTTKGGYVELDECYSDDGRTFSLDSGYDWVDDVLAWMPLPEPYNPQESEDI